MENNLNTQKSATLSLIRKMEREDWLINMSGYEAFEQGSDYVLSIRPEFTIAQVEDCVTYAMIVVAGTDTEL